jgi:protein gp37
MEREWIVQIKHRCCEMEVSFFFKQWGGVRKKASGRELYGRNFDEMPIAQLRQRSVP